ncbi:MAG: phosphate ABC transporter permease PstA [Hyphomicrobiales bacterium]
MTEVRKNLIARRYAAERRFRIYGAAALAVTALFIVFLLADIVVKGLPAFTEHKVELEVTVAADKVDSAKPAAGDYEAIVREALRARFPTVSGRSERRKLNGILSQGAADDLRRMVVADPALIGKTFNFSALLSDDADLFFKGRQTDVAITPGKAALQVAEEGDAYRVTGDVSGLAPGQIIRGDGGALRVTTVESGAVLAEALVKPATLGPLDPGRWDLVTIARPEADRRVSDQEILWLTQLKSEGLVEKTFAWRFFTSGDSREPELAGLRGALIGSILTVIVTLSLAIPLGIAAAVYLEEFARKNRFTDLIEININNLAAVPSIIFGLLGLAMFLNFFGLPRSAPLVGGLVLALLVLPTIIIAARAALRAVPPSIKEAALGVGASHQQAVFHHVLPLALPGILTGVILGLARAFGETAPLLMIGMVAFIVDIPGGFRDAATVLPVQIFLWSDLPEIAFQSKTAAAIMVLLAVLFCLNAIAIYLRRRFERRW